MSLRFCGPVEAGPFSFGPCTPERSGSVTQPCSCRRSTRDPEPRHPCACRASARTSDIEWSAQGVATARVGGFKFDCWSRPEPTDRLRSTAPPACPAGGPCYRLLGLQNCHPGDFWNRARRARLRRKCGTIASCVTEHVCDFDVATPQPHEEQPFGLVSQAPHFARGPFPAFAGKYPRDCLACLILGQFVGPLPQSWNLTQSSHDALPSFRGGVRLGPATYRLNTLGCGCKTDTFPAISLYGLAACRRPARRALSAFDPRCLDPTAACSLRHRVIKEVVTVPDNASASTAQSSRRPPRRRKSGHRRKSDSWYGRGSPFGSPSKSMA